MGYLEKFYELSSIPHGSGNTKLISDYLLSFAKRAGVLVSRDEHNNIIMIKEAAVGYEEHEPVILQGHMDMVTVKEEDCFIDMKADGLDLYEEGGYLMARGTSLGGDDGIAVAYIMDIMENNYPSPKIEAIITVDEETGMLGASAIDLSGITAKRMINIDQEEEGIFIIGCAGGAVADFTVPVTKKVSSGNIYSVRVTNLKGGHSGIDIDKNRGNAIKIIADELYKLKCRIPFALIEINAGVADNAIPNEATARIMLEDENLNSVFERELLALNGMDFYFGDEKNYDCAMLSVAKEKYDEMITLDDISTVKLFEFIKKIPYGIIEMNKDIDGMIVTSANPGIIVTKEDDVILTVSVRSQDDSKKEKLLLELGQAAIDSGIAIDIHGQYPGWNYTKDTVLEKLMVNTYEDMYGKKPQLLSIHAGLECGVFSSKIPGLSCISIGPDIFDIHTVNERLPLDSAKRCFEFLLEVLKRM